MAEKEDASGWRAASRALGSVLVDVAIGQAGAKRARFVLGLRFADGSIVGYVLADILRGRSYVPIVDTSNPDPEPELSKRGHDQRVTVAGRVQRTPRNVR